MTQEVDALRASYEHVLFAGLAAVLAAVPADQVAVQWDVAVEFFALEATPPNADGGAERTEVTSLLDQHAKIIADRAASG